MRSFRKETQLTLRELATLLDVSHNLVAMDEKGLRNLPRAVEKKLEMLQDAWRVMRKDKNRHATPLPEALAETGHELAAEIQIAANKVKKDVERLEQKLEELRERYQLLQQRLKFIQIVRAGVEATEQIAEPLRLLETSTIGRMKDCCPAVQQQLEMEHKILSFKYQQRIEFANRFSAPPGKAKK
ncbi:hypothetical protein [Niabella sp.]|uniref:hypothetical protein n=1 Tax=Niabella sp. TaxID=1962976 RepID=UPI0026110052|nr:hypothetical protein [Niabella sp.]